jgi:hypothetical protein
MLDLTGIPFGDLAPPTLLGVTVLLILLGRLKPKVDIDKAEEAAEKWRLAYEAEREARSVADAQTAELLELAKTTHSIVLALFGASDRTRQSGGADVVSAKD